MSAALKDADRALQPLRVGSKAQAMRFDRHEARLQFRFSLACLALLSLALVMVLLSHPLTP